MILDELYVPLTSPNFTCAKTENFIEHKGRGYLIPTGLEIATLVYFSLVHINGTRVLRAQQRYSHQQQSSMRHKSEHILQLHFPIPTA